MLQRPKWGETMRSTAIPHSNDHSSDSAEFAPVQGGKRETDESERSLIRCYQATRETAIQERLVRRHERLVWSIAWRFRSAGEPIEDLAQEGFIGLLKAMRSYDPKSPAKFSSYAAVKI